MVGDDQAEDGVAEELESLVGLDAAVLGAPRTVAEGELEQVGVVERVAEPDASSELVVPLCGRRVDSEPRRLST